jgi:GT2 family glycosyltransferase
VSSGSIAAIVPNWNGAARLRKLLPSLAGLGSVIVVDNGSSDESQSVVRASRNARCIQLDANYGFAKAVNTGILAAPPEAGWIAILNNDIALAPGFFEHLMQAQADFAAPRLLRAANPEILDGAFDLPAASGAAFRAGAGRSANDPAFATTREIHSAPMTAALFRREVFDKVGLLDESFGSYLEDVDFGIRCALAGCRGVYVPSAIAYHEGGATLGGAWSRGSTRLISRNQLLLARKYGSDFWPAFWGQALWGILAVRHGAGLAWLKGKLEGARVPIDRSNLSFACQQNWRRIVFDSEKQIRELHADWYWRQYFRGVREKS